MILGGNHNSLFSTFNMPNHEKLITIYISLIVFIRIYLRYIFNIPIVIISKTHLYACINKHEIQTLMDKYIVDSFHVVFQSYNLIK